AGGIHARRFNAAGVPQGPDFQVNSTTTAEQISSTRVAMDADGKFVIVWQTFGQDGDHSLGIYAQHYDTAGIAQGTEFHVNTFTTDEQRHPSVGMDADGDFVITWEDIGQGGIYAQRYHTSQFDDLGVWRAGKFYLDSNQSDDWSGSIDDTLNYFGSTTDKPLVGDWNGDGYSDI
ncbi:MAG: hypothetical protein KDA68_24730, partial [Planctomycetaceae bacterium]|nr:hypothetical protein [Planctomycetaceae bacterium]